MSPDDKTPADEDDELEDLEATESESGDVKGGASPQIGRGGGITKI